MLKNLCRLLSFSYIMHILYIFCVIASLFLSLSDYLCLSSLALSFSINPLFLDATHCGVCVLAAGFTEKLLLTADLLDVRSGGWGADKVEERRGEDGIWQRKEGLGFFSCLLQKSASGLYLYLSL